jgi:Right handed beta helix region
MMSRSHFPIARLLAGRLIGLVTVALMLALPACAGAKPLAVDRASIGGRCDDDRPPKRVRLSSPWCTLERAVQAAPSGSRVLVRAGTYPELEVQGSRARTRKVAFRPFGSEVVTIDGISTGNVSRLRFERFRIRDYVKLGDGSRGIELVRNDFSPHGVHMRDVDGVLIEGNRFHDLAPGASDGTCGCAIWGQAWGEKAVRNVTVRGNLMTGLASDGVHFGNGRNIVIEHNTITSAFNSGDGAHVDAIQIMRAEPLVIRGNRIQNTQHGIMFTDLASRGVLIENNVLAQVRAYALNAGDIPNARIVNNTFWGNRYGVIIRDDPRDDPLPTGIVFKNNIVDFQASGGSWFAEHDFNLIAGGNRHGRHDIAGRASFVDPQAGDFHLAAGSKGIDAGTSTGTPQRDRDGHPRRDDPTAANTGGGTPDYYDIGAHER